MKIALNSKFDFATSAAGAWFREIVTDPRFHAACQATWMDYTLTLPKSSGPNDSCDIHNQQFGAKTFLNKLLNIADLETPSDRQRDPTSLISPIKSPKRPDAPA